MADEQTPPKRDVNELFTLEASNPTPDHDGPLAHLLSTSPVSDLGHTSDDRDDPSPGEDDLPSLADVSGLEDLYVTTTDLPVREAATEPLPPTAPNSAGPAATRSVEPGPAATRSVEPGPAATRSVEPEPAPLRPKPAGPEPAPVRPHPPGPERVHFDGPPNSDPFRTFEVGGNLRFSTEAAPRAATSWPLEQNGRQYPVPLVPNAVPTPVAPSRSVRVPGQERRRGPLFTALVDVTERRWFWASVAGFLGVVLLGVLTVGNIVPNPLADDRTDVVAENRLPTGPTISGATETSEADTSSSTGAGTDRFEPADPTTSIESTTASTAPTSTRRVVTTARPTVRSTTSPAPTSTITTSLTSTSVSSTTDPSSSSTTDPGSSSTTDPSSSTTTSESTTTDTTDDSSTTTENDPPTTPTSPTTTEPSTTSGS